MGTIQTRAFEDSERLAHVALVEFPHEVDDISTARQPMIEPHVLAGIDLEGRRNVSFAYRAVIPQLPAALARFRGAHPTALEVDINRDRSGLVSAHRSKLSGKVGEGKHL